MPYKNLTIKFFHLCGCGISIPLIQMKFGRQHASTILLRTDKGFSVYRLSKESDVSENYTQPIP